MECCSSSLLSVGGGKFVYIDRYRVCYYYGLYTMTRLSTMIWALELNASALYYRPQKQ